MPDNADARKKETSQSSENIEIPPIPKQTAGAVAGAAVGSIAGPIGDARLLQQQGGPSGRSLRAPSQSRNKPPSDDPPGSLSLDRAKLARVPAVRSKEE
jgi:hypothetical protein